MKPFAIIIFGSPGSGKSTQAELLAKKYGITHFNTGKFLERYLFDPARSKSAFYKRERERWLTGKLNTPSFVLKIMREYIKKFASQRESLVFSGSPRTVYEVMGDSKHSGFVKILEKKYGKNRIRYLELRVEEKDAKKRNSKRIVCGTCATPLLGTALNLKIKSCPFCGGKLYKRKLDSLSVIQKRFRVYKE